VATKFVCWSLAALFTLGCSSSESGPALTASSGASGATTSMGGAGVGGAAAGSGSAGAAVSVGGAGDTGGTGGANMTAGAGGNPGSSGNGGTAGSGPAALPALRWIGRVEPTANGARLSWPGTGLSARFNGTAAHVSLKTDGVDYFEVELDGQASMLTTQAGSHVYDVAKNLSAGEHQLTLWRRTEPNHGVVEAGPVTFDGTLLAPPAASSKRLEIVGDSISVGFGIECKTAGEAFSYATENNYLSYQALTARKLGAELSSEAWSGIGMWRDVGGGSDPKSQMPDRFLYTIPGDASSVWDFSRYTPDAVLVLLGTNDFAKGDPGQPFLDTYKTFVASLRTHYPKARQYYAVSPMLGGASRTAHKAYLDKVVLARNAAGDLNVNVLEFAPPASDAWGCGHPNAASHAIMAGVLEQALSKDLGW